MRLLVLLGYAIASATRADFRNASVDCAGIAGGSDGVRFSPALVRLKAEFFDYFDDALDIVQPRRFFMTINIKFSQRFWQMHCFGKLPVSTADLRRSRGFSKYQLREYLCKNPGIERRNPAGTSRQR